LNKINPSLRKDAENVFGQIFEFFGEDESEIDFLKIKKSFLLSLKILSHPLKGFKIFETVIGNNSNYYEDFVEKYHFRILEEDLESITR
jgi:hypothetical protein